MSCDCADSFYGEEKLHIVTRDGRIVGNNKPKLLIKGSKYRESNNIS